jgi:threonine dehydratase
LLPSVDTPLVRLGNLFPNRQIYAKCEHLAPAGSFKIHGAAHLLGHLSRHSRTRQLVVPSMGNTALGAALGVKAFGFGMVGVVPQSLARAKDEKLQALGVELIKVPGGGSELLRTATRIAEERGAYFVHPHLDTLWTDGYQAIVAQILRDVPGCKTLVFPVGGGGLLMGVTEYFLKQPSPAALIGCEAYNFPTYARYSHTRSATVADGLILDDPHAKVQRRIEERQVAIRMVHDADIRSGMRDLYVKQGLVVEPSSAVTTAFVKAHLSELDDPVCVILTGGNITPQDFSRLIAIDA